MKLKIGLFGSKGKMGQAVSALANSERGIEIVARWDRVSDVTAASLKKVDVVVDFSGPAALVKLLPICGKLKIGLVTGTTGLSKNQEKLLKKAALKTPVIWAPNFGLGIRSLRESLGPLLKNFSPSEVIIEDIHHRYKKDAPSGTAKLLAETISKLKPRSTKLSPTVSIRGGEVFGVHRVYLLSDGEWILLEHQATDRKVFARGALLAAQWIKGRRPGLYTFDQVRKSARGHR